MLAGTIRKAECDIEDTMDALHNLQSGTLMSQQTNTVDEVVITKIRANINDLHEEQCKFQAEIDKVTNDYKRKETMLSDIANEIKNLQVSKVDEDYVKNQLSGKADKSSLVHMLTMDKLDTYSNELDHRINNLTQQIIGNEARTSKTIDEIFEKFNEKMNRDELKEIRGYIDERFRNFKPKFPQMQQANVKATASRKPLQSACISCDQAVVPREPECSPLPFFQALPGMKSMRPMTTFELQNIRQHMNQTWNTGNKDRYDIARQKDKLQKEVLNLCDVGSIDELADKTKRNCGGGHTSVIQEQLNHGTPPRFYRQEYTNFQNTDEQKFETDVRGRDGHIYKGRIPGDSPSPNRRDVGKRLSPTPSRLRSPKPISSIAPRYAQTPDSGLVSPTLL